MSKHPPEEDGLDELFARRRKTLEEDKMPSWDQLSIAIAPGRSSHRALWLGAALAAAACVVLVWSRSPVRPVAIEIHPTAAVPDAPSQPTANEPIRLRPFRTSGDGLWIVAKEKGFFAEERLDVELDEDAGNYRPLDRGRKRFATGAVVGYATAEVTAKRESLVDIGSMFAIREAFVMRRALADKIDKSTHAFKGTKIGDITCGEDDFTYNNILRVHLEKAGLTDGKDFQIVEYIDTAKEYGDLVARRIDIAKVFPPSDLDFVKSHPDFVSVPVARYFSPRSDDRQVITRSQLKENRGKYVRLLRAAIRAHRFIIEHPTEASAIIGQWLEIPPTLVHRSLLPSYVTPPPEPLPAKTDGPPQDIDTSLYRDALFGLARENTDPASQGYFDTMIARYRAYAN